MLLPAHIVVQSGNDAGDGTGFSASVVEDVYADNHEILEGSLASPELTAQLAVQLQDHLLSHGVQPLLIRNSLHNDHLRSNWLFDAAEFLNGRVSIGFDLRIKRIINWCQTRKKILFYLWNDGHDELNIWLD